MYLDQHPATTTECVSPMAVRQPRGDVLDILNTPTKIYYVIMGRKKALKFTAFTLDITRYLPTLDLVTQTSLELMERSRHLWPLVAISSYLL